MAVHVFALIVFSFVRPLSFLHVLFRWVFPFSQETARFPQSVELKAEPLFPATGGEKREQEGMDFLAAKSESVSAAETDGEVDLIVTETQILPENPFSPSFIPLSVAFSATTLFEFVT